MKYGQNAASDKQRRKRQSVEARATIEAAKLIRERGTAMAAGAWMACPGTAGQQAASRGSASFARSGTATHRGECRPHFRREDFRLFERCKVAAPGRAVPVEQVGECALRPFLWRRIDFAREH